MTNPGAVRQQKIDAFAAAVAPSLTAVGAVYQHGPMGGHEWRWSNELGVWALHVGGMIDAGPRLTGPGIDNRWRLLENTLGHADLVLIMLQLAGGIPGPDRPVAQIAGSDLWSADDGVPVVDAGPRFGRDRRDGLALLDRRYVPVSVKVVETGELTTEIPYGAAFTVTDDDGPGIYYLDGYVNGAWVHYTLSLVPGFPLMVAPDLQPDAAWGFLTTDGRPVPYMAPDGSIATPTVPRRGQAHPE